MKHALTLGFSPCPNDTFIFDALVNHKIDSGGLTFDVWMKDVQALNLLAMENKPDITKISFYAFAAIADNYELLDSGSALGKNCGPILVAKRLPDSLGSCRIAIPGTHTTANFLLNHFFPFSQNKYECLFSGIEDEVLNGNADAGLIIHESRFTYEKKGLLKVFDLGELWERETHTPLPLGGIAIKKDLPATVKQQVNQLIRKSIEFAYSNPASGRNYIKDNSQEMEDDVIAKHISLYVNEFSIDLGEQGKKAVSFFLSLASQNTSGKNWFLNPPADH